MRFCGNCGAPLTQVHATEERKVVTVLFVDVVESTQLAGAIDPEQFREKMSAVFAIAREEIERRGGTVEKYIGDAVMAVFGLPTVHEDDPQRAAQAAAAIRTRLQAHAGRLPTLRFGIDTGEVVANPAAVDKGEFLVTGEVVNLTARLQQHAGAGQILVGERAALGLRQVATLSPLPSQQVKGARAPVPVWELVDVAPLLERKVQPTPFVGRAEELDLLTGLLRRMRGESRGHVITLLGPAGTGKTRLVLEFRNRNQDVHALSGRALPYGTGVPFWALGETIREECGIVFGDPREVTLKKLHEAADRLEISNATPALQSLLGLATEEVGLTREDLFSGMHAFFQALAARTPLLLILEDLQVAEEVTLDFVEYAADWLRETPLLIMAVARPDLLERRTGWMGGKRGATTLFLDPLSGAESRALIQAILREKPAPDPVVTAVLTRADGNPLFMEEMLRALIERGALVEHEDRWHLRVPLEDLAIPDTVQAVIAARLDALPVTEKRIVQAAALQGKDFWLGGLHLVADENHIDEALRSLVTKELIVSKRRSTLAREEEFTFRHILIRDVAYASIPKAQRWSKHARVAAWMQQVAGDRRAEFADFIAYHWLQVVTLRHELGLPADNAARKEAIDSLLLAGDRAASVYANATAIDHYSRAVELDPPFSARLRAHEARGDVWMLLGQYDRARDDFTVLRTLAKDAGETRWEAVALDHLGHTYRKQDQIVNALAHLEPALALSREVGDPTLTARILTHMGFTHFSDGRYEEALHAHQEARQLLAAGQDPAALAESLHGLGENTFFQGRFTESISWLRESMQLSSRIGNRSLAAENEYMIAHSLHMLGQYHEAQAHGQRSLTTLREIGDVWNQAAALWVMAHISVTLGEFGRALECGLRGLSLARELQAIRFITGNLDTLGIVHGELEDYHGAWHLHREADDLAHQVGGTYHRWSLAALAVDAAALGRLDEAARLLEEGQQTDAYQRGRLIFRQEMALARGRVALAKGAPHDAAVAARALLNIITTTGTRRYETQAMLLLADAKAAAGDHKAALSGYQTAAETAQDRSEVPIQWRALVGQAEVLHKLSQSREAAAAAKRARELVDLLSATVTDERLRATFLQSAPVQRLGALAGI
jgi:class 3 adenylate cyclase/tetratricopeptide (TPR) repeat protein